MVKRVTGYDCPVAGCEYHCDEAADIALHTASHREAVTQRPEGRWVAVREGEVLARGELDDLLAEEFGPGVIYGMVK